MLFKFILGYLLFSSSLWAQEKSILFLDTNDNPKEIAVARAEAQKKGMKLIVYPNHKDFKAFDEAEVLKLIEGQKIKSVVLSGHNGGTEYGGEKTAIKVGEVLSVLEKSGNTSEVEALYLLGCNTANKSKLFYWKSALPNLKFVAGYDGTAPLGHVPTGLNFFKDVLNKQDQLIKQTNAQELKRRLEALQSVNAGPTSILTCLDEYDYLFMSKRKGAERFGVIDSKECTEKISEFNTKYLPGVREYWEGEREPEKETGRGLLYEAYVHFRQNEHCFGDEDGDGLMTVGSDEQFLDGDSLLQLRFNKAFNQNALKYYASFYQEALKDMEEFLNNPEAFIARKSIEAQEKLDAANKLLADPNLKARIDKFATETKKELQKLKSNPVIAGCINGSIAWAQCTQYEKVFDQINLLDSKIYQSETLREDLEMARDNAKFSLAVMAEFNTDKHKMHTGSATFQETLKILRKISTDPKDITRKDIATLANKASISLPFATSSIRKVANVSEDVFNLGSSYPFSWHEISPLPLEEPSYFVGLEYHKNSRRIATLPEVDSIVETLY